MDQRGCGRSLPHAGEPGTSLLENTTGNLIDDIELLRAHLRIDRWLVLGGSWGSTLALAYAERYPDRVTELVLFGVTAGRRKEFDWTFREGLGMLFPKEWEERRSSLPHEYRDQDIVGAYARLLAHHDSAVQERAARAWCLWESATPEWPPKGTLGRRFEDLRFALAFARIVTHYVRHDAWLGEDVVFRDLHKIEHIPAVLINGRFDFQTPIATAYQLHMRWPKSELVIVDDAGHSASDAAITREIISATDRFATAC